MAGAAEGQLGVGQAEGLLGDRGGHAGELVEDRAGLDHRHVVLDRALALPHAHLGRLLGDRLVREHADPELALALEVPGDRDARGLDLLARHGPAAERLQAVLAECERVSALRVAGAGAFLRFAVFGACGL
jgi:hypothetical protein